MWLVHILSFFYFSACPFYAAVICQQDTVTLTCPAGEIMTILGADYGRTDTTVCRNGRYADDSTQMTTGIPCALDITDIIGSW